MDEEATSLFEKTTITFDEDRGSSDDDELEKTIIVLSSEEEKVRNFAGFLAIISRKILGQLECACPRAKMT